MAKQYSAHEDNAQRLLFQWAPLLSLDDTEAGMAPGRTLGDFLIAYPGGGKRSATEAAIMKALGTRAGVFDVFCPIPIPPLSGLWLEMKKDRIYFPTKAAADRALSDNQQRWGVLMREAGYSACVAYGFEEAAECIGGYLRTRPGPLKISITRALMLTRRRGGRRQR